MDTDSQSFVARACRLVWPQLPTLLASGTQVCLAGILVVVLAPGLTPLALILWAVVVGPLFVAMVGQVVSMMFGEAPKTFSLLRYVRNSWRPAFVIALPPACTGACGLVGLEWWRATRSVLALGPTAVCGATTLLLVAASIVALPLALDISVTLRGLPLLLLGLHIAVRRPVPVLGVVAILVAVVQTSIQFSASIVLMLPAPLALTMVAAAWTSAGSFGMRPTTDGGESD